MTLGRINKFLSPIYINLITAVTILQARPPSKKAVSPGGREGKPGKERWEGKSPETRHQGKMDRTQPQLSGKSKKEEPRKREKGKATKQNKEETMGKEGQYQSKMTVTEGIPNPTETTGYQPCRLATAAALLG